MQNYQTRFFRRGFGGTVLLWRHAFIARGMNNHWSRQTMDFPDWLKGLYNPERDFAPPPPHKGRSLADPQTKQTKGQNSQKRPKSEKRQTVTSAKTTETPSAGLLQKTLDDYLPSLSNFELKEKLERCPGNIVECPVINDFRQGLKKSVSNHASLSSDNESRLCKTSRGLPLVNDRNENEISEMSKQKSNESGDHKPSVKEVKTTGSTTSRGVIRSTRAQDLRSQSNRDLLKPKTTGEKTRSSPTSPYVGSMPLKKKKGPGSTKTTGSTPSTAKVDEKSRTSSSKNLKICQTEKVNKERASAGDEISLQRQKTQEIINPKIVKKTSSSQSTTESAAGDCEPPQLKKSQTFFICKGTKNGEGDDKSKVESGSPRNDSPSDGNATDDDLNPHKPKPLTHNDSFCLIVKSSQNWSQKNRSDDEKWLHYGLAYEEKTRKATDKGILKNSNYDLKSVDSLEKVESEKIVRFSDELLKNKKVLKKLVRRKKRLQNFFTPNWYKKNKLFQKYLQILREKSVLLSDRNDTPEHLKPFRVPIQVKERYEAEMFGLYPRKGKFSRNQTKDSYSY